MRRVVITGQGTINALGNSVAKTQDSFKAGRLGIGPLDIADVDRLTVRIGAQVQDFDAAATFTARQIALFDRFTQFAMVAANEAMRQSGLVMSENLAPRAGVILGTAGGGVQTQNENYRVVFQDDKNRVHPFVVPRLMNNAAAAQVAMAHNLQGPCYSVATACASSNHAMGQAFHLLRCGAAKVMLAGGSESMLCFGGLKAWEGLRILSPDGCRPFSADRNGMVQGEGAAVFVFEDRAHAMARGADILAEVIGFAMTSDAGDIVLPSVDGAARAMAGALRDAGISPDQVGYINAHGTGTTANDRVECAAISQVFGAQAENLMVSSTKSMHGHLIGGAGAVELLACIMAVRDGVVAPTISYRQPDPDCALDVVPNQARQTKVDIAMSNAFAFGGMNAVLLIRGA